LPTPEDGVRRVARLGASARDQFLRVLRRKLGRDDQDMRGRRDRRDRSKIALGAVGQVRQAAALIARPFCAKSSV
jgi:hypothetical protein